MMLNGCAHRDVNTALDDSQVTNFGASTRLLDQVDVISAVSGGSYTAAYYGLFGDRLFEDFGERFLRRNWPTVELPTT